MIVLAAFAAVVVIGLVIARLTSGSNHQDQAANPADTTQANDTTNSGSSNQGDQFTQLCISAWNSPANTQTRGTAQSLYTIANPQGQGGGLYVSVNPAANFNQLCLVTVVAPASQGLGEQYLQTGPGRPYQLQGTVNANNLPDGVNDWNATMRADGTLAGPGN